MASSPWRAALGSLAIAGFLVVPASAQSTDTAKARLEWAKNRTEQVCDIYDRRGEAAMATRCYDEVAQIVADTSRPLTLHIPDLLPAAAPVVVAPPPPARTVTTAPRRVASAARRARVIRKVASIRPVRVAADPARCGNLLCSQYILLGTAF